MEIILEFVVRYLLVFPGAFIRYLIFSVVFSSKKNYHDYLKYETVDNSAYFIVFVIFFLFIYLLLKYLF